MQLRFYTFLLLLAPLTAAQAVVNQYGVHVPDDYTCRLDIPYKQTDTWTGYFDFYCPSATTAPAPLVINIHGGGWDHNQKEQEGGWKPYFACGMAVANMEYRLTPQAIAPAAVEDVQDMIRYVIRHARELNIDTARIILTGASAGGHLALMGGYTMPDKVFAVVDRYGVADVQDYLPLSSSPKKWIGKHRLQDTAFIREMSPLWHVSAKTPPTLIIHGDSDRVVPYRESVWLADTLRHYGVMHKLFTVPGGGHGRFSNEYKRLADRETQDFLCSLGLYPSADIRDYGAVSDGKTLCTGAIQQAIDDAAERHLYRVLIPEGDWLTGTVRLRSGVQLYLVKGARLIGSTDLADYPEIAPAYVSHTNRYTNRCLIYAANEHDVSIAGEGTIDGRGGDEAFRADKNDELLSIRRRPYVIRMVSCRNIRVHDITLLDSPAWMQQYLNCENLSVRGIHVDSHHNFNNDGLDIDCCRHVRIYDCDIRSDDDAICMKATNSEGVCEDIRISSCRIAANCNSVKIGTETNGDFRDIHISDCVFTRPDFPTMYPRPHRALAGIALEIADGGTLEDVHVSRIRMRGIMSPVFIRLADRGRNFYDGGPSQPVGKIRNITISGMEAVTEGLTPSAITSVKQGRIENVLLQNIRITLPGGATKRDVTVRRIGEMDKKYPENLMYNGINCAGLYIRHASGITLDNVQWTTLQPDCRPLILTDDAQITQ
ncbi:MAG: prolyl oligopeptidase family serine peptidase [Paludibacteraceae bacterium]|nr:prolyl oligopeptidase family serine peptidase [Paludibacteraceae bacterium]